MSVKIDLNWDALDALLQFKVSLRFCADYLGVGRDTIMRNIKQKYDMTFSEYHALKMENTATKLQQKAIEMALGGNNTMMIFCLKNLANWSDQIKQDINISEVNIKKEDEDL